MFFSMSASISSKENNARAQPSGSNQEKKKEATPITIPLDNVVAALPVSSPENQFRSSCSPYQD